MSDKNSSDDVRTAWSRRDLIQTGIGLAGLGTAPLSPALAAEGKTKQSSAGKAPFDLFGHLAVESGGFIVHRVVYDQNRSKRDINLVAERCLLRHPADPIAAGDIQPAFAGNDRLVRDIVDETIAEQRSFESVDRSRVDG